MPIKKFNAVAGISVGDDVIFEVIDDTANITANNLTVTATTTLGDISNVKIDGGIANYVLKTDGLGNLSWENPLDVGVIGNNTEVQFNDNGLFGSSANFTYNKTTDVLTAGNLVTNNITVTGNIIPTTTEVYNLGNSTHKFKDLWLSGNTVQLGNSTIEEVNNTIVLTNPIGGQFIVDGSTTQYSSVASTVSTNAQPNITSTGTLIDLNANGNINFSTASNINLGTVSNLIITGGANGQILQTDGTGNVVWVDNTPTSTVFTANSISLTGGVYVSGDITSIQTFGDYSTGNVYVLTDGTGTTPAWYADIDFLNVDNFNRVVLNINYTQASGHTIYVQLYNNTSSAWDNIGTYTGLGSYYAFALQVIDDTQYLSSGRVQLRLYHSNGGNSLHTTSIDYAGLELSNQGPQGPKGSTGATGATGPGVATGGTAGQLLVKANSTNYATTWTDSITLTSLVVGNSTSNTSFGNGTIDASGNITANNFSATNTIEAVDGFFSGNIDVLGNLNASVGVVYANSGILYGNATTGEGAMYAGVPGYTPLPYTIAQFGGNIAGYAQINFENINPVGTTDYVLTADTGTDTSYYLDMGIAGSQYDNSQPNNSLGTALNPLDGYIYAQGLDANPGGNLVIGTTVEGTQLKIISGGHGSDDIVATFANTAVNVSANLNVTGELSVIDGNINIPSGYHLEINGSTIELENNEAGVFNSGISNINIGLGANVNLSATGKLTTVNGNLKAGNLEITGDLSAGNIQLSGSNVANSTVTNTLTANNLKVTNILSNRAKITVTNNTVIDSFPINRYRSAKYTIRVASDDGYQAIEVLLVHDDVEAFVTIYGSLSTSGSDMVFLTANLVGTTVSLLATATTTNTDVNMIASYVTD